MNSKSFTKCRLRIRSFFRRTLRRNPKTQAAKIIQKDRPGPEDGLLVQVDPTLNTPEFPLFPQLPTEIRLQIWREAFPITNRPTHPTAEGEYHFLFIHKPFPITLRINHESREETLRIFQYIEVFYSSLWYCKRGSFVSYRQNDTYIPWRTQYQSALERHPSHYSFGGLPNEHVQGAFWENGFDYASTDTIATRLYYKPSCCTHPSIGYRG